MAGTPLVTLDTPQAAAQWLAARVTTGTLRSDSRRVQPGDGHLAWRGHTHDGRRHVRDALANGAAAVLVEADGADAFDFSDGLAGGAGAAAADGGDRVAGLRGLKAAAGEVADAFHGAPSARLAVVAVTGTNGKSSTSWWTAQALSALGRRCAVVGTLGAGEPPAVDAGSAPASPFPVEPSGLTTPDAVALHTALRRYADAGFAACAIEASSIGIVEHRLAGLRIRVAAFTNLTRDHLDYHGDMAAYWAAKRALFRWPGLQAAVVTVDSVEGAELAAEMSGSEGGAGGIDLWTVSRGRADARLRSDGLRYGADGGLAFDVVESGGGRATLVTALVGDYNVQNLLVVVASLRALGVPLADAAAAASRVTPVPGRMQRLASGDGVDVVVDYAHTPDALEQVLAALKPLARSRGGRLWCLFGCGGHRDASKRPLMGAIAAAGADRVVLTSDNPRDEAPDVILAQVLAGCGGRDDVAVFEDRRQAIVHAVVGAAPGDVVLLAGKGHEDYQEIAGEKRPFSDVAEARAAIAMRAANGVVT